MKRINEKGITLVALVVTIIILLILAGITINIALSENGLFRRTKESAQRYKNASENEFEILDELDKTLAEISGEPLRGDLKAGDTVLYTPTKYVDNDTDPKDGGYTLLGAQSGYGTYSSNLPKTLDDPTNQTIPQQAYTWKVLNIDDIGNVEIVGVPTDGNDYKDVYFGGALGYNNGVYLLDDMCNKLYSNTELGTTARSIDIEDIQKGMNKEGEKDNTPSGEIQIYKENFTYYPEIYNCQKYSGVNVENEQGLKSEGISESDATATGITIPINNSDATSQGYKQAKNLTVKYTTISVAQLVDYYKEKEFYTTLFPTGANYWVATRCSYCDSVMPDFSFSIVNGSFFWRRDFFYANGDSASHNSYLCPVVSLGANVQLTKDDSGSWTPRKISK